MGYLEPGEEVVYEERPHGAALVRPLTRSLVLTGLGIFLVVLGSPIMWGLGAIGVLCLAIAAALALLEVWR